MTAGLDLALLIGAAVLLVAVGAVRVSTRVGVPSLLVYLLIGMGLGESGLGIRFDDAELTRTLGFCALLVIIAEGGLTARWTTLRPVLKLSAILATLGVAVSIAVVGAVVHVLLGLDWRLALLYGAVLSSTDAAAVFATLRRLRLRPRLVATLEAESGMNDAPVVLLVVLLSTTGFALPWWHELGVVAYELAAGAAIGITVGVVGRWLLRHAALPSAGLYPIAAVGLTVLAYAAGAVAHASGFLAVYVAGVVLGNARLPHRRAILGFADGLAWLAQIGLFVLLGLLVSPDALPAAIGPALVVGGALVLLARPLSVWVSAVAARSSRRLGWRGQAFLSWAGLRGAVPIVLATIPLSSAAPGADGLFNAVFVLVIIFTLVQAGTLAPVARWLGVTAPAEAAEIHVETAPLERMRADLLQIDVAPGSRLAGVHIDELRLPVGSGVTLVVRDGAGFVPGPDTRLRTGDSLLIVATAEVRDLTERRMRAVSRRGRLARWFGEDGADHG
ncbi:K+/H+ antiporter [Actinoplanes sp. NBRC 14428]|uniref:Potassium/proton antiporter (CPA1 family) n=1 Tax=Pseudosporangium ferrugineum TaxID=439699 RepID=A0A2T0S9F5_9ACTN|nr:potassium/proton antiporter [Pseudosporangium ferrugineum]PRY30067.1 potassium/proton antiporter (CPA1 family) [Pseudosporangium ferrugineum]BCJ51041.1 K+/H+ antiporter [Actinoplanes sp. NBRC 14428]